MRTYRPFARAVRAARLSAPLALLVLASVFATGCKPDYPSCETDKDCHPKEFCVANNCRACAGDKECPGGQHCVAGSCTSKKPCKTENECAQNEDCVNGFCTTEKPPAPPPT